MNEQRPKLFIVSTEIQAGKGGISTALVGFKQSQHLFDYDTRFVISHSETSSKWLTLSVVKQLLSEVRKNDIVWLHCARWLSISRKALFAACAKLKGAKVVMQYHSLMLADYVRHPLGKHLMKMLMQNVNGNIVLTNWWKEYLQNTYPQLKQPPFVLANPLDTKLAAQTAIPKRFLEESGDINVLVFTRLVKGKGVDLAIKTMSHLPSKYKLIVAGDGSEKSNYQQLAKSLKLGDRVDFLGWIEFNNKHLIFEQCDLFLLPTEYDSFGMGFLEAMAHGLPVVAINKGPIADVVPHNQAGLLSETACPADLAKLVQLACEKHQQLSQFGQNYAMNNYKADVLIEQLNNYFMEL